MVATPIDAFAPFDAGAGASVTEDTWRRMMRNAGNRASGVLRGLAESFAVVGDSSGMQVKVRSGECWIEGHWGECTATKTMALAAAHTSLTRYDLVVVRLDSADNVIELDTVPGTPSASPTIPSPSQSSSLAHEIPLAYVTVTGGVTTITASDVTDYRQYTDAFALYTMSGTQSVATGVDNVAVQFATPTTASYDVRPAVSNSQFTLMRAGWWTIEANTKWAAGTTGSRRLYIGAGGNLATTKYAEVRSSATPDEVALNGSVSRYFSAGDVVSVGVQHTQGAALNLVGSSGLTWVAFTWKGY